ncbi:MAG: lytic murein transglycosylase [Desulforhopalus sp.]|nr:lytic murein transglycosylase [Desulforhopalus sp.]
MMHIQRGLLSTVLLLAGLFFGVHSAGATEFQQWLAGMYPTAAKQGVSRAVWDAAFTGVTEPDLEVLEKAAWQPEFKTEIWDYLDSRANSIKAEEGKRQWALHRATLNEVSRRFGVDPAILLAIWSMETNYGAVLAQPSRLHYVPRALATLAWKDSKRRKYATSQLIAALKILAAGDVKKENFTGSWAGAMGQTQFIPTSYLAYGVDMDHDGRRDIWNSIPDALGTAASLLQHNKWSNGGPWGFEAAAATGNKVDFKKYEGDTMTLKEWSRLGMRRPDGSQFPFQGERAELKLPAGAQGPAFLLLKNFFVIKRYNNADAYALAVGLLADYIRGRGGVAAPWPRPAGSLGFQQKLELQQLLTELGNYDGKIDGSIGSGSRQAIRDFQGQHGLLQDGEPTATLLGQLKKAMKQGNAGRISVKHLEVRSKSVPKILEVR